MVTVDVLIPHYNDPEGLEMSLRSIAEQDWKGNFRVVVCDDGSKAESLKKVEQVLDTYDGEVVLIKSPVNLGRPKTRNILLDNIASEYVAWLDAGDEWYPTKIRLQFEAIYRSMVRYENKNVWVTCSYDWKWVGGRARTIQQNTKGDQVQSLMMGKDLRAYLWTLLAKAEAFKWLGKFDEELPRLQDLDYFLRFASQGGQIVTVGSPEPLCVYHKSDMGRNGVEVKNCFFYIYNKHKYLYSQYSTKFRKNRRYDIYMHAARFLDSNGDTFKKISMNVKAFLTHPTRYLFRF